MFLAALVPASFLVGGSLWLNARTQQEMTGRVDETLDLAINLQQTLLDADLTRMQDQAVSLAASPLLLPAVTGGPALTTLLDTARAALPVADLVTVVDQAGIVRGRAGATATGERLRYGGLVDQVLNAAAPMTAVTVIPRAELAGDPRNVVSQVRLPVTPTPGATDPGVGPVLEDALALVGAAPVLDPAGRVIGAVLVTDILNNDNRLVDEVANLSPHGVPMNATVALNNIRVATNVPAPGAGHRAVGT
ncbi:MAG: putative methyl-accepting chemotaxis protein, partial [Firmicutes bacterium]|nr:putative methyl-accepting chemotaxis protein [Bacillota bacterium]